MPTTAKMIGDQPLDYTGKVWTASRVLVRDKGFPGTSVWGNVGKVIRTTVAETIAKVGNSYGRSVSPADKTPVICSNDCADVIVSYPVGGTKAKPWRGYIRVADVGDMGPARIIFNGTAVWSVGDPSQPTIPSQPNGTVNTFLVTTTEPTLKVRIICGTLAATWHEGIEKRPDSWVIEAACSKMKAA
jgi:hypothetical protein